MLIIAALVTLLIVIATVLPLFKNPHWMIRSMDFPRLQITCLAGLLLCVHFVFLDLQESVTWFLLVASALCFFWQLWWVLPYTPIWPYEVKASAVTDPNQQLSIITANVLQTNQNSAALIALVNQYQPDILVTLESDQCWQDKLQVLETQMPYSVKCPLDNLYGMHVYSRLPFSQDVISYLVEDDIPSIHFHLMLRSGVQVQMHFVHPEPPSPTENTESAERDAELITIARSVGETEDPVIVTGDLNDVAWSATTRLFRKISGLLDPRVGRGMFNTFHVDFPFLRWPLDHLFHSAHFTVQRIKRLPTIGSDHFPLYSMLTYTPAMSEQQEGLTACKDDREEAKDISKDKNVSKDAVPS